MDYKLPVQKGVAGFSLNLPYEEQFSIHILGGHTDLILSYYKNLRGYPSLFPFIYIGCIGMGNHHIFPFLESLGISIPWFRIALEVCKYFTSSPYLKIFEFCFDKLSPIEKLDISINVLQWDKREFVDIILDSGVKTDDILSYSKSSTASIRLIEILSKRGSN